MFMINTPLLFRGFWSVIKGFLDERTLAKIKVSRRQASNPNSSPNVLWPVQYVCYFFLLTRKQRDASFRGCVQV